MNQITPWISRAENGLACRRSTTQDYGWRERRMAARLCQCPAGSLDRRGSGRNQPKRWFLH